LKKYLSAERATDEAEQNSAYYRLIHISPSYWKIRVRLKLFPNGNFPLDWNSHPKSDANSLLPKTFKLM